MLNNPYRTNEILINSKTRLNKKKIKEKIKVGNEKQPYFYIINYLDSGFAIVSSDIRFRPILAYSEKNNINVNNLPPAFVFLLEDYIKEIISVRENDKYIQQEIWNMWKNASSSGWNCDLTPSAPDCQGGGNNDPDPTPTITTWGPYLETNWGQEVRYNDNLADRNCTSTDNGRVLTGCVATATAQILRYWEFPLNRFDWDTMPNGPLNQNSPQNQDLAEIMEEIGDFVNMDYGCNSSSANTSKIRNILVNEYGYSSTANYKNYNATEAKSQLQHRPIILRACRERIDHIIWVEYDKCHAWVADGYRTNNFGTYITSEFHMNWGWNGNSNGWYSSTSWSPGNRNYKYQEKMLIGIKP